MRTLDEIWGNPWEMVGTEAAEEYYVLLASKVGRLGVRNYEEDFYQVRIEPAPDQSPEDLEAMVAKFPVDFGWEQPSDGNQHRFSKVILGEEELEAVLLRVKAELNYLSHGFITENPAPKPAYLLI